MLEPGEPQNLSKKEEKRQRDREATLAGNLRRDRKVEIDRRNRRILLALGGTVLVAGAGLLFSGLVQPGSEDTDYAKFLKDSDTQAQGPKGQTVLLDRASEITERSLDQVARYLGTKPTPMDNIHIFTNSADLNTGINKQRGCEAIIPGIRAYTVEEGDSAWIGMVTDKVHPQPATDLAESAIHEDLHARTRSRSFTPEDSSRFLRRDGDYFQVMGLKAVYYRPEDTVRNLCTAFANRQSLGEAITQYSALQILAQAGVALGPKGFKSMAYVPHTTIYTEGIGSLFVKDHKDQLLIPALESDTSTYFRRLGTRMDAKHNNPGFLAEQRCVELFARLDN